MNGAEFKTLRQLMGLKLEWMANRLDIQPRSLQRMENENKSLPAEFSYELRRIQDAFRWYIEDQIKNMDLVSSELYPYYERFDEAAFQTEGPAVFTELKLPESCYGAALGCLMGFRALKIQWQEPRVSSKELAKPTL